MRRKKIYYETVRPMLTIFCTFINEIIVNDLVYHGSIFNENSQSYKPSKLGDIYWPTLLQAAALNA